MSSLEAVTQTPAPRSRLPPFWLQPVSWRWLETEQQAYEFGRVYDSYFATEDGWKRFHAKNRSGLIAYRRLGRQVKVLGGLLASDEDKPGLLREFTEFADAFRLVTAFYNITDDDLSLFRDRGFQVTKWGEEPIIDLQERAWSGRPYEWVRRQTNFCHRAGITITEHRRDEMDDASWMSLRRELRAVSDALLATKPQAREIQLVEGQLEVAGWGRRRLFVAYSQGARPRIEGFLIALPMLGGRRWSFEMYRHRPDAVRGVIPHLFHEAMTRMKAEGIESVSLCLIPGLGCEESLPGDSVSIRRALCFGKKYLNFVFDFAGLYHFKSRFRPRYENRFICARPGLSLMTTLALFRMSGLLTFDRKKVVRILVRNYVKRRERRHLAHRNPSLALD